MEKLILDNYELKKLVDQAEEIGTAYKNLASAIRIVMNLTEKPVEKKDHGWRCPSGDH